MVEFYSCIRPLLMRMDAEDAHRLALRAMKAGFVWGGAADDDPALAVTLWNRKFPNPVGLAAGFDKNAEAIGPAFRLGFGFVEAGTVTPKPQDGNPRPRIFRDQANNAVINRMGFPNQGLTAFRANLERFLSQKPHPPGLLGINIGMNKTQDQPARDYCLLVQQLGPVADYLTVNISSPNTPGLRDLQSRDAFLDLAGKIIAERERSCAGHPVPVLVKLSPDLSEAQQEELARAAVESGVDGLILTNTTLDRPGSLDPAFAAEKGGLSGQPVRDKATATIRNFYRLTGGKLPIIGVGGIASADNAYEKIRAGASLVQVYTGMVYQGPGLVRRIKAGLSERLRRDGFASIAAAVGADA